MTKEHAADYLFGETADANGTGVWLPPSQEQLERVKKVIPVSAMDLSSDA